ncbi:zinc ribbon domain-containing protein [Streptomyces sp. ST2-7A]|uniref:zinc ribbon domain-containing protein n=1 Tax=Streptomyces sp. ST2-7A TaxID=2907214 RepID=UPI001F47DCCF|nr:C4-type zinc ribbon domain-containing protein [Streptomyces sp. ST2-7A]MCE7081324.1 C4-type zinc ribbon domain-containing protein [Streptomyces sp. ST2-7A]
MNAEPADQLRLLDLQALDIRLTQLDHRLANLPEHAELRELEAEVTQQRDLLVAARAEESDTAREQTKAEQDVDQVRRRAERNQQRLDSGAVANPKDLESLQSELVSLARRQDDLENVVLEIMERHEAAAEHAREADGIVGGLEARAAVVRERRDTAVGGIEEEAATVRREREAVARTLPEALLKLYDRLRGQYGGIGAARLYRKQCEGCRLELDITELNDIRRAPADTVVRCENCGRVLVRTADSGL